MSTNIATAIPQLNSGEIYAGAIIQPNGSLSHIILLPEQLTSVNFPDAQQWALKFRWAGMTTLASLPTKNELEHLFAMSRAAKARRFVLRLPIVILLLVFRPVRVPRRWHDVQAYFERGLSAWP